MKKKHRKTSRRLFARTCAPSPLADWVTQAQRELLLAQTRLQIHAKAAVEHLNRNMANAFAAFRRQP
ncbi:hypothetical protein ACVWYF_004158 [Hymenobacter sp. UYAg731]